MSVPPTTAPSAIPSHVATIAMSRGVGPAAVTDVGPTVFESPTKVGSTSIGTTSATSPPRARNASSAKTHSRGRDAATADALAIASGHAMARGGTGRGRIGPPSSSSSTPAGSAVTGRTRCPSGRGGGARDHHDPELAERRLDLCDLRTVRREVARPERRLGRIEVRVGVGDERLHVVRPWGDLGTARRTRGGGRARRRTHARRWRRPARRGAGRRRRTAGEQEIERLLERVAPDHLGGGGEDDLCELRDRRGRRLEVDRLEVEDRVLYGDDDQVPEHDGASALPPQRELGADRGLRFDARLDLLGTEDRRR